MGAAQSAEEKEEERQRRIAAEYQKTLEAKQEYAAQIRALEAQVTEKVTAEVTAALEASHRTQVLGELKLKQTQAAQDLIKESKLACAGFSLIPAARVVDSFAPDTRYVIGSVTADSDSVRKGLKPGMLVTSVNGVHLRGKSRHAVKRLLLGTEGSVVTLAYNSGKFHSSASREDAWKKKLGLSMPPEPAAPITAQLEVDRDCGLPIGDMANLLLVLGAGTVVRVTEYGEKDVNGHEALLAGSEPHPSGGIPVKLRHNGQERTVPAEHLVLVKIAPDLTGGSAEE